MTNLGVQCPAALLTVISGPVSASRQSPRHSLSIPNRALQTLLLQRLGYTILLRISPAPIAPCLSLRRSAVLDVLSTCLGPAALLHLSGRHAAAAVEVRGEATHRGLQQEWICVVRDLCA